MCKTSVCSQAQHDSLWHLPPQVPLFVTGLSPEADSPSASAAPHQPDVSSRGIAATCIRGEQQPTSYRYNSSLTGVLRLLLCSHHATSTLGRICKVSITGKGSRHHLPIENSTAVTVAPHFAAKDDVHRFRPGMLFRHRVSLSDHHRVCHSSATTTRTFSDNGSTRDRDMHCGSVSSTAAAAAPTLQRPHRPLAQAASTSA